MDIGIEMSLYPLTADFIPPIQDFIDRLNAHGRFKVVTNSMSTQVFGPFDDVFQRAGAGDPHARSRATPRRCSS